MSAASGASRARACTATASAVALTPVRDSGLLVASTSAGCPLDECLRITSSTFYVSPNSQELRICSIRPGGLERRQLPTVDPSSSAAQPVVVELELVSVFREVSDRCVIAATGPIRFDLDADRHVGAVLAGEVDLVADKADVSGVAIARQRHSANEPRRLCGGAATVVPPSCSPVMSAGPASVLHSSLRIREIR